MSPSANTRLAEIVPSLELDIPALQRKLKRCNLAVCHGNCCHDGVYLEPEEATMLRRLVLASRPDIKALGIDLPENPIVYGSWRGVVSGPKTAVRQDPKRQNLSNHPSHFPKTSCVFLLPDARCALQALAMERDLPPWTYKPISCWLHPLTIEEREGRPSLLTLHDETNDPQTYPDYPGFVSRTQCGCTCADGEPAWQVLQDEIAYLGQIGSRDLLKEIAEHIAEPDGPLHSGSESQES